MPVLLLKNLESLLTMKHRFTAIATALLVASAASLQAQLAVPNLSFEKPGNHGSPPFPAPDNWSSFGRLAKSGVIDHLNANIPPAADGSQWLFLAAHGSANGGVVSESIGSSEAGDVFEISFALGENRASGAPRLSKMDVFVQGSNDGFDTNTTVFSSELDPSKILGEGSSASHSVILESPGTFKEVRIGFRIPAAGNNKKDQVLVDKVAVVRKDAH